MDRPETRRDFLSMLARGATYGMLYAAGASTLAHVLGCADQPASPEYWQNCKRILDQATTGTDPERIVDKKILDMVEMLGDTLQEKYKDKRKKKLGWIEFTDIDRKSVTTLDNYVTNKSTTWAFMIQSLGENFNLVERFLLQNVIHELSFETTSGYIDGSSAKKFGRIHGLDFVGYGVRTWNLTNIDLDSRIVETQRGEVVAVGTSKIPFNETTELWLRKQLATQYKREPRHWE